MSTNLLTELPDMESKEFLTFLTKAIADSTSSESKTFYYHLLKVFTDADNDSDGCINVDEFTGLIDIAAKLPRHLGFAPSKDETFKGDVELMKKVRAKEFSTMDINKDGTITFNEFLSYVRRHIAEKLELINQKSDTLYKEMPDMGKDEFHTFLINALNDPKGKESKIFYYHLLKVFTEADLDHDGTINVDEFSGLIDRAAALPRKLGFAPTKEDQFKGDKELMKKVRADEFATMDFNKDGNITFNEFLAYTRKHVKEYLDKPRKNK